MAAYPYKVSYSTWQDPALSSLKPYQSVYKLYSQDGPDISTEYRRVVLPTPQFSYDGIVMESSDSEEEEEKDGMSCNLCLGATLIN